MVEEFPSSELVDGSQLSRQVQSGVDKTGDGIPILSDIDVNFRQSSMSRFSRELGALLLSHESECFHKVGSVFSRSEVPAEALSSFAQGRLRGDSSCLVELGDGHDLGPDTLTFFGTYLVRPIRVLVRAQFEQSSSAGDWSLGYCPVCGLWPPMARLEPEVGRRFLWCIGCDGQWQFPRIRCPFCLERDQEKLGYLTVDGWPGYRVYTCDSCGRYIKCRDERRPRDLISMDMDTDYLSTFSLDTAAGNEGYRSNETGRAAFGAAERAAATTYREKAIHA